MSTSGAAPKPTSPSSPAPAPATVSTGAMSPGAGSATAPMAPVDPVGSAGSAGPRPKPAPAVARPDRCRGTAGRNPAPGESSPIAPGYRAACRRRWRSSVRRTPSRRRSRPCRRVAADRPTDSNNRARSRVPAVCAHNDRRWHRAFASPAANVAVHGSRFAAPIHVSVCPNRPPVILQSFGDQKR